jgi:hypothetical protein
MRYVARAGFAEYMVGDSMADQTTQIDRISVDFLGQIRIADLTMDRNGFGGFEMIYGLEGEVVNGLQIA